MAKYLAQGQENYRLILPTPERLQKLADKFPHLLPDDGLILCATGNAMQAHKDVSEDGKISATLEVQRVEYNNSPIIEEKNNLFYALSKHDTLKRIVPSMDMIYNPKFFRVHEEHYEAGEHQYTIPIVRIGDWRFVWLNREECESGKTKIMEFIKEPFGEYGLERNQSINQCLRGTNDMFEYYLYEIEKRMRNVLSPNTVFDFVLSPNTVFDLENNNLEESYDLTEKQKLLLSGLEDTPENIIYSYFNKLKNKEISVENLKEGCTALIKTMKDNPTCFTVEDMLECCEVFKNELSQYKKREAKQQEERRRNEAEDAFLKAIDGIE